jgi:hypothetical protein
LAGGFCTFITNNYNHIMGTVEDSPTVPKDDFKKAKDDVIKILWETIEIIERDADRFDKRADWLYRWHGIFGFLTAVLGVPIATGQKTTLSQFGIRLPQRAKAFAAGRRRH